MGVCEPANASPATGMIMTKALRLTAHPVSRILCATSHETVGYLYEWNNGDRQPAWIGKPVRDVSYERLTPAERGIARSAVMTERDKEESGKNVLAARQKYRGLC